MWYSFSGHVVWLFKTTDNFNFVCFKGQKLLKVWHKKQTKCVWCVLYMLNYQILSIRFIKLNHHILLRAISANKATGIDGIISHSLKAGAPDICDSLAFIMNLFIFTASFINDWKVAKVIHLNKSGNASEVSNYWHLSHAQCCDQ